MTGQSRSSLLAPALRPPEPARPLHCARLPAGRRHLFLAWTDFQRRQLSMQGTFGYAVEFMGLAPAGMARKLAAYLCQAARTFRLLRRERPDIVWVQLPPLPLLAAVLAYRWVARRNVVVVGDCHNGVFRRPWTRWPGYRRLLGACDVVLLHNHAVALEAGRMALHLRRPYVLEDCPARIQAQAPRADSRGTRLVLFPAGFANDEPIGAVLETARRLPDVTFVLTGRLERARANHDLANVPANVELPGFIPAAQFDALLASADVVLALTTVEGIQLSACNEAIGAGKPMVLSDTVVLRQLFGEAAVFVRNDADGIAGGLLFAFAHLGELRHRTRSLESKRTREWLAVQAAPVLEQLEALHERAGARQA